MHRPARGLGGLESGAEVALDGAKRVEDRCCGRGRMPARARLSEARAARGRGRSRAGGRERRGRFAFAGHQLGAGDVQHGADGLLDLRRRRRVGGCSVAPGPSSTGVDIRGRRARAPAVGLGVHHEAKATTRVSAPSSWRRLAQCEAISRSRAALSPGSKATLARFVELSAERRSGCPGQADPAARTGPTRTDRAGARRACESDRGGRSLERTIWLPR